MKHLATFGPLFGILGVLLILIPASAQTSPAKGKAADAKGLEWNQWRGPKRDGISPDTGLLKQWPAGGPPLAWKVTGIGDGYSSVSFAGEKIFTMGDVSGGCCIVVLDLTGKKLWTAPVGKPGGGGGYPGPHARPRRTGRTSTPSASTATSSAPAQPTARWSGPRASPGSSAAG